MSRLILRIFFSLLMLLEAQAWAGSSARPLPRHILALYDSKISQDTYYTQIHQRAEVWLNHLGLIVDFHDIQKPLPDLDPAIYRGVLTWFRSGYHVADSSAYCLWLSRQLKLGIKLAILGELGLFKQEENLPPVCEQALSDFGITYQYNYTDNPFFYEIVYRDPIMTEYERKLSLNESLEYQLVKAKDPTSKVYLKIRRLDFEDSDSDIVFTNSKGGYAMDSFVNYTLRDLDKTQWRINPFLFFEKSFAIEGWPRPDTTTLDGKRIFYNQIDGDGIFNLSFVDQKSYSGEVVLHEIIEKHPDLPVSASIIAGYLELPQYNTPREKELYRKIFSLPQVEPAIHGYAHPLVWSEGKISLRIPGYQYSAEKEVAGANVLFNQLLESLGVSKRSRLNLWTGNALPTVEALDSAKNAGLLNLNGGGGRYDDFRDSSSFLFPLSRVVEGRRQIYASFPNENVFTNLWQGPYYGFSKVIESFKNTESPVRLKPMNVYYHYYSGERVASLKAVNDVLNYVKSQDITPIFASQYARIVNDFFAMDIKRVGDGYWIDHPNAAEGAGVRTIRFDHEKRKVDRKRSKGVLGSHLYQGNLYISLNPDPHHEVYLTP